jgi:hypothetical protein
MKTRRAIHWGRFYFAGMSAVLLLFGTGLVGDGDVWYSPWTAHRLQTDAFLSGQFALSNDPADLEWDNAWSMGGVHQVWGLGVPLWRLPWQGMAELAGFAGFPDRLAFGLFVFLVAYIAIGVWGRISDYSSSRRGMITTLIVILVLIGFPPFASMLRARFAMYEEAIAYGYLFALLQATMLAGLVFRPRPWIWWSLCALAGLGGLIRPTLIFYGVASLFCAGLAMMPLWRTAGHNWWKTAIRNFGLGVCIFCLGGGLLWLTNLTRFGNGFEFGHSLNLETYHGAMYATRFDHPFQDEPVGRASLELFGARFLPKNLNAQEYHATGIFMGQSSTPRWREFSFDTYNLGYLLVVVAGWAIAGRALARNHRTELWSATPEIEAVNSDVSYARLSVILGIWSVVAIAMLSILYLRVPWMTSRYTVDFGAAFAISVILVVVEVFRRLKSVRSFCTFVALLFGLWLGDTVLKASTRYHVPTSGAYEGIGDKHGPLRGEQRNTLIGGSAVLGGALSGIPFDREGWNQDDGSLRSLFIVFVNEPDFLELELEAVPGLPLLSSPEDIRAKIGIEPLLLESLLRTETGWTVRFRGPQQRIHQNGLNTAFVASVPKQFLTNSTTPWILKSVRWNDPQDLDAR